MPKSIALFAALFVASTSAWSADRPPTKVKFDDLRIDGSATGGELNVPSRISKLQNQTVVVAGYMLGSSMDRVNGATFTLVRDANAYFPWPITDEIAVRMKRGSTARFNTRPVSVTGVFKIAARRVGESKRRPAIYFLDAATVLPYKTVRPELNQGER